MAKVKDWQCLECGRRMTFRAAERAVNGDDGCPGCGGVDIDLAPLSDTAVYAENTRS